MSGGFSSLHDGRRADRPLQVILVEDDEAFADLLESTLEDPTGRRIEVAWAKTLREALRLLQEVPFDVMILDLHLPDSDGVDSLRAVNRAAPRLPIVVWTVASDLDVALRVIEQGAQDLLVKGEATHDSLARSLRYAIERRAHEDRIQQLAVQTARHKGDLETVVRLAGHDLRQPLRALRGHLDLVAKHLRPDQDDLGEHLALALACVEQVQETAGALQTYAKVQKRRLQVSKTPLGDVLDAAQENLQRFLTERRAEVSVGPLPTLVVDRSLLVELFEKVLHNAVRYCTTGEIPQVRVSATSDGVGGWTIEVADNGDGSPLHTGADPFAPAARLHRDPQLRSGAGMGLTIARAVANRHDGRIWATNNADGGCSVFIHLPERTRSEPPDDLEEVALELSPELRE